MTFGLGLGQLTLSNPMKAAPANTPPANAVRNASGGYVRNASGGYVLRSYS